MSSSKHIGKITAAAVALALVITLIFMNGAAFGIQTADTAPAYVQKLFDTGRVHTIDIVMEDFEGFLETCQSEEYSICQVVIDGEAFSGV
ncbi:MAG: spore coat protein CotH, partial [Clostridia bacterium]|nr:spore coat protein CotH [Clostridia bacterium]